MQEEAKPQPLTDSAQSEREAKLRESLAQMNEELEKRNKPTNKKDLWTYREGVYMVVFQAVIIFLVGGLHGANQDLDGRGSSAGSGLISRNGEIQFSIDSYLDSGREMAAGYPLHFSQAWYADLTLMIAMILVAFLIKETRVRRRCFTMMTITTMAVLGGMMAMDMKALASFYS